MTGHYGLPLDVRFCTRCVISNQRPSSVVERHSRPDDPKPTIAFDDEGVCSACRYQEFKQSIDWKAREEQLLQLLDRHNYRCIVPGSGGKDSVYVAHLLQHHYGAKVITVTAAPILWTEIGRRNYERWTQIGIDHMLIQPQDYRARTREAFLDFLHPFKAFIEEQRAAGPRASTRHGVPLVFYGECPGERGNDIRENESPVMDPRFYPSFGAKTEVHYFGWYRPWRSQDNFYYAVGAVGFEGNDRRTDGTYSKMSSVDDRIDNWHYWTTLCKFGLGRASYNAAEDIRDGFIARDEGVALVKKYDQEFPARYHQECLDFIGITDAEFHERCDAGRPDHLWVRVDGKWKLRKAVWE